MWAAMLSPQNSGNLGLTFMFVLYTTHPSSSALIFHHSLRGCFKALAIPNTQKTVWRKVAVKIFAEGS